MRSKPSNAQNSALRSIWSGCTSRLTWWSTERQSHSYRVMSVEVATQPRGEAEQTGVSSFCKSLFLGEIHEELVFPWPEPNAAEQQRVRGLIAAAREIGGRIDPRKIEEDRWVGDGLIKELGEAGLLGLYVPGGDGGGGGAPEGEGGGVGATPPHYPPP